MRRDTWSGSIWEAFWAHARSSYPLPFWFSDGQRYVIQLGKYDIEVMNGLGYYDETGTYQAYACPDQADL